MFRFISEHHALQIQIEIMTRNVKSQLALPILIFECMFL